MKRLLLLLILALSLCLPQSVQASHIKGGEITWECLGNGQFVFYLKIYRDCNGIPFTGGTQPINVLGHPTVTTINCNQVSFIDITPTGCTSSCNNPNGFAGATQEYVGKSNPITLTGTPPAATGWIFYWDNECCRNTPYININGGANMVLRSVMYPFNAGAGNLNTNPCYDSSPRFTERPTSFICTGYQYTYNPVAVDKELDSLVYSFGAPFDNGFPGNGLGSALTFASPTYSVTSPLPGNVTMNPSSGEMTLFPITGSVTQGNYVVVTKVTAYRCNQKIAEVNREIQITLTSSGCSNVIHSDGSFGANNPPQVNPAPFIDPSTGFYTSYRDTVSAGDTVRFTLNVTEFEQNFGPPSTSQQFFFNTQGSEFDTNSTAPYVNCERPPCAYLDAPTPAGPFTLGKQLKFTWPTSCAHRGGGQVGLCGTLSNAYQFVIQVKDDGCPAPAINSITITIVIKEPDTLAPPDFRCASVDSAGDVTLSWLKPWPIDSFGSFYSYEIYRAANRNGPYTLIDSVLNYNQLSYTDNLIDAQQQPYFYYMLTKCGCDSNTLSKSSDTLETIDLNASLAGNTVTLNWNHMVQNLSTNFPPHAFPKYYVHKKSLATGTWLLVDSTVTTNTLQDVLALGCTDTIVYRVYVQDSSSCLSLSSLDTVWTSGTPPAPPLLRCISVIPASGGNIQLQWIKPLPADTGQDFGGYFIYLANAIGGPYSLRDSVLSYSATSWTDNTANAYAATQFYFIKTRDNCGMTYSVASDTLRPIILSVNQIGGNAVLTWNAPHTPPFSSYLAYKIYKENLPHGSGYTLLTSIANNAPLSYNDPVSVCADSLNYYITLDDNSVTCTMTSTYDGDSLLSATPVIDPPNLRCVSVATNGDVTLTWISAVNTSNYFDKYEIYHATNIAGPYSVVGTVLTKSNTTFIHTCGCGNSAPQYYYVKTKAGCDASTIQTSAASVTLASIYLTTSNATLGSATLNWTALPLLPSSGNYITNSNYNLPGNSWSSFGAGTTSLSATQNIVDCNIPLQHQITVTDITGSCTSQSNIASNTFTYIGHVVDNPDLRCVSVLPNGNVQLTWLAPTNGNVNFNEYEIWRDGSLLDSVSVFGDTVFTDVSVNANSASHSYYVISQSGCSGQVNSISSINTLNTIHLTTIDASPTSAIGIAQLNWNALPLLLSSGNYNTLSNYNSASLVSFGSTSALTANQNITDCNITLQHQITVPDNSGCISQSNIDTNVFTYLGHVVDNPDLRCVSVLPNGNVQLIWLAPTNGNANFNEYEIWRDGSLLDSVSVFADTVYTDVSVNANSASHSYYVISQSGCSGQINSPAAPVTLSTIHLTTIDASPTSAIGISQLNWNALPLLLSSGNYNTLSNYNSASLMSFGSTSALTANQNITDCNITLQHQITVPDNSGCISQSNIDTNLFTYLGNVVDNPDLRCASVLDNGSVQLTWLTPSSPSGEFNVFEIWRDGVLIDSLNSFNATTYNDPINANAAGATSYAYYVATKSGCTGQVYSTSPNNTLNTINVDVVNNNGVADISWNKLHNPDLITASGSYEVFKEYPAGSGSWTSLGTTTNLNYQETITICSADINYKVVTSDASGCTSQSSRDGKHFADVTKPVVPVMASVSVNPDNSGDITITWLPSISSDAIGYNVYLHNGNYNALPNTPTGLTIQTNQSNVTTSINYYSVTAYDSCNNESVYSVDLNTINLKAKLDICRSAVDLKWNPYLVNGGVSSYKVYAKENAGAYSLIATVPGTGVSYSHTTLTMHSTYHYYVEAVPATMPESATSNSDSIYADLLTLPRFSYLKTATVKDQRKVYVEGLVDTLAGVDVSKYKLQRSQTIGGPFNTVGVVNFQNLPVISFIDYTARTDEGSYLYRIVTVDSCGNNVLISNLGRTIFINGHADFNLVNKLRWNDYDGWLGDVKDYSLYRSIDGVWDPSPINRITFGINEYADNVGEIYQTSGKFCYKIQGYEGPGNTYGFADSSMSNEFCLIQEPHLFVPSAFTPGGKNPVFMPSFIYVDPKNYQFLIFTRWGEKIFETNDPTVGWDGSISGTIAEQATYMYLIRMVGSNGQILEKNGRVTLLK